MMIINRFLQIASRVNGRRIELTEVFSDAGLNEVDAVLEALYVIANRRIDAGDPIQLVEIANAIPELIEDESVLEAAVEISIDGLIATGQRDLARSDDLARQLQHLAGTRLQAQRTIEQKPREISKPSRNAERLPRHFGPADLDGQPRYELRRVLGSGNQGVVYEAVDGVFSDGESPVYVALKIFYDSELGQFSQSEGSIARRVRHRNIACVTDQGVADNGEAFVAFELIQGLPLDVWFKKYGQNLSVEDKCLMAIKICEGVQAAHAAGVVHRDIKPSNILIDQDGEPVITDFGISSTKLQDTATCGSYGTRGSLAFMAPEQYAGETGKAAPLVDIYAIGGVLLWMLTARFPNGDKVVDAIDWLENHDQGGPRRVESLSLNPRLSSVLLRSLRLDPSDRYQSATAFGEDLQRVVSHEPLPWFDTSPWARSLLYLRRNPIFVAVYLAILAVVGSAVGVVMSVNHAHTQQVAEMQHAAQVEGLEHEVEVSSVRAEEYLQRMQIARTMIGSWSRTLDADASEQAVLFNLLFLQSQTQTNALNDDPDFQQELLDRKVEVASSYVDSLDPATTSPILRALWHEMIAGWLTSTEPLEASVHRKMALELVERYAPDDAQWQETLKEAIHGL